MKKTILFFFILLSVNSISFANHTNASPVNSKTYIVGGGIIGAFEAYYAYKDAQRQNSKICITVYEKSESFASSPTNTSYNIVPSLTPDEILSVVPRGSELVEKLRILFSEPGGIRVDDVPGVNDSDSAIKFKNAVAIYGSDKMHDDRTAALLNLGKKSMDLWQQFYDDADPELKAILHESHFTPCHEPKSAQKVLFDGYRIDLIFGVANASQRAENMKADYEKLGYKKCKILSPAEVMGIDPSLTNFCHSHSNSKNSWDSDCVALWRPGGCIFTPIFIPKFYAYLKKVMGQYIDSDSQIRDRFQLQFGKQVTGIELDADNLRITGLKFSDGSHQHDSQSGIDYRYVFCPGESVGTLSKLGFHEPAYAAFAGPALFLTIPLTENQLKKHHNFSHCMEVHKEGIVLSWQARIQDKNVFIGVGGTKAFYGDKQPKKDEAFAKNRNLVQLNIINQVLPEFISMAFGYDTSGKMLTAEDLMELENKGIALRWVGRRAVAYDGFPTLGALYYNNHKLNNARCTTHLGSGGVSFGPGAVFMSRSSEQQSNDPFIQKILNYSDSRRIAE